LGQWEIENHYDRVVICGKKLYAMHKSGTPLNSDKSWKMASKGARLNFREMISIAAGETVHFENIAPTFSAMKREPTFVDRDIKATAQDIRFVPRRFDPMFKEDEQ
jgi:hypothetical protein